MRHPPQFEGGAGKVEGLGTLLCQSSESSHDITVSVCCKFSELCNRATHALAKPNTATRGCCGRAQCPRIFERKEPRVDLTDLNMSIVHLLQG